MSDLVKRLRNCCGVQSGDPECCCAEAADEIERLRAENATLEHDLKTMDWEQRNHTIERCARVANNEAEAPGDMPPEFYLIPIEDAIRAAIRATKKSIATAIRALKNKP